MKYYKIRGTSISECMMKLRGTHGADAIILEHREINEGGLLGSRLFSRKSVEVEYMLTERNSIKSLPSHYFPQKKSVTEGNPTPPRTSGLSSPSYAHGNVDALFSQRDMQKDLLEEAKSSRKTSSPYGIERKASSSSYPSKPFSQTSSFNSIRDLHGERGGEANIQKSYYLEEVEKQFRNAQMSPAFTNDCLRKIEDQLSPKEKGDYSDVERKTLTVLREVIRVQPSQAPIQGECRAYALIGPTGAGKTTSLAKLAARFHIAEKREVSIYSLDQYRLAATEQLKTYASVMGIDFHAPLSKEEFVESLRRDGAEMILIDTSGISYSDNERLHDLDEYLRACEEELNLERSLVLAANTNPSLLEKFLLGYGLIGFDKLILTKVDEAEFIGPFVEVADKFKRSFSFITSGQEVPTDIRDADSKEMATMALSLDRQRV